MIAAPSMRAWPGGHAEADALAHEAACDAPSMRAWPGGHAEAGGSLVATQELAVLQ